MRVRHLSIRGFRGIKQLDWQIDADLVCLVGPGDSCKTTVLDALELVLSERYTIALTDADFYGGVVTDDSQLTIEATISDPPTALMDEQKFGHWMRGVSPAGEIHDDPEEGDAKALTVRFTADSSLEPRWCLYKHALEGEERVFTSREREKLGIFRVDNENIAHLRWARGSALTKLDANADATLLLAEAQRAARAAVFTTDNKAMSKVAKDASTAIRQLAAADLEDPRAGIEILARPWTTNLSLHDGDVPMTRAGLGTRRLAGTAIQLKAFADRATILLDEVELGLEPHRLRHLLLTLKRRQRDGGGQTFVTTHSPQVVDFLETDLQLVRCHAGIVKIQSIPDKLAGKSQGWVGRTFAQSPSALLARRIVVGEGATESGFLTAYTDLWADDEEATPALAGASVRRPIDNSGGSEAPFIARMFRELGFETLLFADDDLAAERKIAFDEHVRAAKQVGVEIVLCEKGKCLEQQVVDSLPDGALASLINLAVEINGGNQERLNGQIATALGVSSELELDHPLDWSKQHSKSIEEIRNAVAMAATDGKWFKSVRGGYRLGSFVSETLAEDQSSHLAQMIVKVKAFVTRPIGEAPESQIGNG